MIILGIDPGTTSIGYALLLVHKRTRELNLLSAGVIRLQDTQANNRLFALHQEINTLIARWHPGCLAIEKLFFAKNVKTALAVSEARGAVVLTAALAKITVYEYTPLEIKKTVTGDGRADKLQMQKMMRLILPKTALLRSQDDTFDAIATSYTCYLKEFRASSYQAISRENIRDRS